MLIHIFRGLFPLQDNSLLHVNTKKCAEITVDGKKLKMSTCTGVDRQIWLWKRKAPDTQGHAAAA